MRYSFRVFSFGILLATWMSAFPAAYAVDDSVKAEMRREVTEAKKDLGTLDAIRQQVFAEEIATHPDRFVKDYKKGKVEIDLESMQRVLALHGPDFAGDSQKKPALLVYLKKDSTCAECETQLAPLRRQVRLFFERHGFDPQWMGADPYATIRDVSPFVQKLSGKELDQYVAEQAQKRGLAQYWVVEWGYAPGDPDDVAHADEHLLRVRMKAHLVPPGRILSADTQKDFLPQDRLDDGGDLLLIGMAHDLGKQWRSRDASVIAATSGRSNEKVSGGLALKTEERLSVSVPGVKTPHDAAAIQSWMVQQGEHGLLLRGAQINASETRWEFLLPGGSLADWETSLKKRMSETGSPIQWKSRNGNQIEASLK